MKKAQKSLMLRYNSANILKKTYKMVLAHKSCSKYLQGSIQVHSIKKGSEIIQQE